MKQNDQHYFDWALMLAQRAFENGYSPVGAVVVEREGGVFYASSKREIGNVLHAEFLALLDCHDTPPPSKGLTLYSTLEPCIMCSGMAAVMKVERIVWLVDNIWAGASRVCKPDNDYIQQRFPTMEKAAYPRLHKEAQEMWVNYLRDTGHADAVSYMLGLPEDYQCK